MRETETNDKGSRSDECGVSSVELNSWETALSPSEGSETSDGTATGYTSEDVKDSLHETKIDDASVGHWHATI
jgi:hypothetical protein